MFGSAFIGLNAVTMLVASGQMLTRDDRPAIDQIFVKTCRLLRLLIP